MILGERGESHDDELAVPERGKNVGVASQNGDVLGRGTVYKSTTDGYSAQILPETAELDEEFVLLDGITMV